MYENFSSQAEHSEEIEKKKTLIQLDQNDNAPATGTTALLSEHGNNCTHMQANLSRGDHPVRRVISTSAVH